MSGTVLRVFCALFLKGIFAANPTDKRVYEDYFYSSKYNGSEVTWMMIPDDNGLVVSAIISGFTPNRTVGIEDVKFHLWTRNNPYNSEIVNFDERNPAPLNFKLNPKRQTVFLIHGFTDTVKKPQFFNTLVEAFLKRDDYNVIGVDWASLASVPWYGEAVKNTLFVGRLTAKAISAVRNLSPQNPTRIHVVAHNLGALVAGVAGHNIKLPRIEKITGLDPAFIHTNHLSDNNKLNKLAADLVEVVHTSGDYIGINDPIGHRDFYPNGGKWPQPGCLYDIADRCSPVRAFQYYAEALTVKGSFLATKCKSYENYLSHDCDYQSKITMVNDFNNKLTGKFYLTTESEAPFSNSFVY